MPRSKTTKQPSARGLTSRAAIEAMLAIEKTTNVFCNTAPRAVAWMGGRAVIEARLGTFAVGQSGNAIGILGPVPRLSVEEWQAMAAEHVASQRIIWDTWRGVAAAGERPGPGAPSSPSVRARSLEVQRCPGMSAAAASTSSSRSPGRATRARGVCQWSIRICSAL